MIRIHKTPAIPAMLSGRGVTESAILNQAYSANSALYRSATGVSNKILTKMSFDSGIYGDSTVKTLLINDQHEKCCFCEAKFLDNSYGDVEHFRPKGAYQKRNSGPLTYPGYYWLGYDWDNLLFSCEKCNRSYKRNYFPLQTEATRKPFHNHPNLLQNEDCLLVNPNMENPANFITFREEVPVAINGNDKGKKTIEAFQLERMNNTRMEHLLTLELALTWTKIDPTSEVQIKFAMQAFNFSRELVLKYIGDATSLYDSSAKDTAKFAHCVRCKFPHLPIA